MERSRSGRGAHLWIFFEKPIEAALARKFGNALLRKGSESVNLKSFRFYDRMLPMQDHLPPGGLGNLIALPLQGQALLEGNSAFIDEDWNAYPNQWEVLFEKPKLTQEFIGEKIKEWQGKNQIQTTDGKDIHVKEENPWEKKKDFCKSDVDGTIRIVLADAVYVETKNLKPQIQNRIRELAVFSNPKFYKNLAVGLSNFQNARYIYLGQDVGDYIKIPRGLLEKLIEQCEKAGILYRMEDKRCFGRKIDVTFCGELKDSQIPAVRALAEKDMGILSAATAFGKTVVCSNLIAKKKVNTLILLQQSSLMPQWENAFNKFLQIEEEPPEYETPTGRRKRRKSVIGTLQGSRDTMTGIIDIAMVGSLCKKASFMKS